MQIQPCWEETNERGITGLQKTAKKLKTVNTKEITKEKEKKDISVWKSILGRDGGRERRREREIGQRECKWMRG